MLFLIIPFLFFAGLILIPIGLMRAKRHGQDLLESGVDRRAAWRNAITFLTVMTGINVILGTQVTYRAVEHMETEQFCGQSCHVMKPEFTGHQKQPHHNVACVDCHVAPGARGWVQAKVSGTRQLVATILNNFPRPIESAMESNKLVPSEVTCELCHDRNKIVGSKLKVRTVFAEDEANTRTETALMMHVGGGTTGGIHGAHMGPGVKIRYGAADKKRESIPWVEYSNGKETRAYLASTTSAEAVGGLQKFEMQCVDCHNRPAHSFALPGREIDQAMLLGEIPRDLASIKKIGIALLTADYKTEDEAAKGIQSGLEKQYPSGGPNVRAASGALLRIYQRNVFPDLKVTWGTYPNHLGHTDNPGCFRCHDGDHTTQSNEPKAINQDCSTCHEVIASEEASPEALSAIGLNR
jgi:nitrate/TMAO reductase-like tetraheme cytochrome c subunit